MSGDGYPAGNMGGPGASKTLVRGTNGNSTYSIPSTVDVAATSANFTASRAWTLPAAATYGKKRLVVADEFGGVTSSFTLVITRAGSDTINGGTTFTLSKAYGFAVLISDGVSKWTVTAADCLTSPVFTTPVINGLATGSGVASAATASTLASRDSSGNTSFNNVLSGYATTATAAGTTTLTASSKYHQFFTGTSTQTVVLPGMATVTAGQAFRIVNQSTGIITVNANGGVFLHYVFPGFSATFTSLGNLGFEGASWWSDSHQAMNYVQTGDFTVTFLTAGLSTHLVDTSGGNVIATLASGSYTGRYACIKKIDAANKLTITPAGGLSIDGVAADLTITGKNEGVILQKTASLGWVTIPQSIPKDQIIQMSRWFGGI